jgi:hypothetical protein
MFELGNFLTFLLLALGWCLITTAVRNIFITVRMAITEVQKRQFTNQTTLKALSVLWL